MDIINNSQKSEKKIIFIVGNSRSGTTMTGRILGNNPEVFTFMELHFFERMWSSHDKEHTLSRPKAIDLVSRLMYVQRKGYLEKWNNGKYLDEAKKIVTLASACSLTKSNLYKEFLFYETKKNAKKFPCEQTPRYVFYINDILNLYPNAKIINLIRDPRDVLLSQKRKWKRRFFLGAKSFPIKEAVRMWANYHPLTTSKLWNSSIVAAKKYSNHKRVLLLRYEDLIENPETQIARICDFLKILFNPEMIDVPQVGSSIVVDQPLRMGINKNMGSNWEKGGLNSTEIYINQKINNTLMIQNGYVAANINPNYLLLIWYKVSFPLKLLLSFILNLKRIKNIRESIKRRL